MAHLQRVRLESMGEIAVDRQGDATLVSIGDVTAAMGKIIPAGEARDRTTPRILAIRREGRRIHHLVDIPTALAVLGGLRGIEPRRRLEAIEDLVDLHTIGPERIQERRPLIRVARGRRARTRPPGTTVVEMLAALGMKTRISARQAGRIASERYQGARHAHPDGQIFEDAGQLAAILTDAVREEEEIASARDESRKAAKRAAERVDL